MKNFFLFIGILLLLSGCITVGKFEKRMEAKKGLTKEQLIDDMGIPAKEYKTTSFEILEYYQSQKVTLANSSISTLSGKTAYTNSFGGSYNIDCKLEFKLVNGIVTNYRYSGDLCRSK